MTDDVLRLEALSVALPRGRRVVSVLDALDLAVPAGEMLALVGESGSGKTMAALAVMRLLPPGAVLGGRALLRGQDGTPRDLLRLPEPEMRRMRGRDVGMVFQNPLAALNPSHTVGAQIAEAVRAHTDTDRRGAMARARELLDEVGIPDAANRLGEHPHQFSGGMRQRVMIASALACSPRLLIADEPTTGLDPLVARQIMALLARLRRERGMGVLFVTHDLSVVEEHASRVHVLYAGRSVEWGAAGAFFEHPSHPYSQALLGSVARVGRARLRTIPGTLPEPESRPPGCRFAPRCAYHRPSCDDGYPAARAVAGTMACCLYPPEVPAAGPRDRAAGAAGDGAARAARRGGRQRALRAAGAVLGRAGGVAGRGGVPARRGRVSRRGGRERVGQVHAGARDPADDGLRGAHPARRARPRAAARAGARPAAQAHPGGVPGPAGVAEPAHDGGAERGRAAAPGGAAGAGTARGSGRVAGARGAAGGAGGPAAGLGVGRAGAAHRHRARAGRGARRDRARRADLGAGRVHAGDAAEPAQGPGARAGAGLRVHLPRPGGGQLPRAPDRGAARGADRGAGGHGEPAGAAGSEYTAALLEAAPQLG